MKSQCSIRLSVLVLAIFLGMSHLLPHTGGLSGVMKATASEWAWSWHELKVVLWSCEKIETDLGGIHQPQIDIGPNDELVVQAVGRLYHSVDGGWNLSCSNERAGGL